MEGFFAYAGWSIDSGLLLGMWLVFLAYKRRSNG